MDVILGAAGLGDGDPVVNPPDTTIGTQWCELLELEYPDAYAALSQGGLITPGNAECLAWYNYLSTQDDVPIIGPPVQENTNQLTGALGLAVLVLAILQ